MHVILREQGVSGSEESTMCLSRDTQTAIILQGDFDKLDQLVAIAASYKVPKVYLIVSTDSLSAFKEAGWDVSTHVLLEKKANGK